MRIVVFTGPSLAVEEGRRELDAVFLPPVSQGDVYSATLQRPFAIGIVDGFFERLPAVWHKEILWALAQGVHVFGSASMGALRAAELGRFGMVGVGRIFEAFDSGRLEDDDEVTVVHGAAENGFRPLSEAMVNIRFTLEAAEAARVIGADVHRQLTAIAKGLFYPRRTWPEILEIARRQGLAESEIGALEGWLPSGRVDQKRQDALLMLRHMAELAASDPGPKQVAFTFQHTDAWEQVRLSIDRRGRPLSAAADEVRPEALLEELRILGPGQFQEATREALVRALALEIARHRVVEVDAELLERTTEDFRRERNLLRGEDVERWIAEQGLDDGELRQLMRDEARIRHVEALFHSDAESYQVEAHLRTVGRYGRLAARARQKQGILASQGLANPGLRDCGEDESALWSWYFGQHQGVPVPADLAAHARASGFKTVDELRRAAIRELLYQRLGRPATDPTHVRRA